MHGLCQEDPTLQAVPLESFKPRARVVEMLLGRRKVCPGYIAYNRTAQPCWSCRPPPGCVKVQTLKMVLALCPVPVAPRAQSSCQLDAISPQHQASREGAGAVSPAAAERARGAEARSRPFELHKNQRLKAALRLQVGVRSLAVECNSLREAPAKQTCHY